MILLPWEIFLDTIFQKCSQMFVLICHCGGTCLIRILHSKNSTAGLILDYHGKILWEIFWNTQIFQNVL